MVNCVTVAVSLKSDVRSDPALPRRCCWTRDPLPPARCSCQGWCIAQQPADAAGGIAGHERIAGNRVAVASPSGRRYIDQIDNIRQCGQGGIGQHVGDIVGRSGQVGNTGQAGVIFHHGRTGDGRGTFQLQNAARQPNIDVLEREARFGGPNNNGIANRELGIAVSTVWGSPWMVRLAMAARSRRHWRRCRATNPTQSEWCCWRSSRE